MLKELKPGKVFQFFEEICQIPHGSGHVDAISDYLVAFARDRDLEYHQDKWKNVILMKEATAGYEDADPVMIQGHMDMVAVADDDADIDMQKDPLRLGVDGDFVYARGTSLGGDDGIAVAYALAILDSDDIPHPKLEVVFTVDEEVGMDGAREIDLSMCRAKRMLNIDSEEEGYLLTSCAGGASFRAELPWKRRMVRGVRCVLSVSGLQGGHSGTEIDKERGNANVLLARIMYRLSGKMPADLYEVSGGQKDNAIPNAASVTFVMQEADRAVLSEELDSLRREIANELRVKDPGFAVDCEEQGRCELSCVEKEDAQKLWEMILTLPCGVCGMSASVSGLVETSLNLGIVQSEESGALLRYGVRSSVASRRDLLLEQLKILTRRFGAAGHVSGLYPGWEYREESPLRETMKTIYREMFGKDVVVQAIHAGVECGFFAEKIPGLDCVSFGPDILDIHSTRERLSISSAERMWRYLLAVLEAMKP